MILNAFLAGLAATAFCAGCPENQVRLGKKDQYVYLKGPFSAKDYESAYKACEALGEGWTTFTYEEVAKEVTKLPQDTPVYSYDGDIDTNAVIPKVFDPKSNEGMAAICGFSKLTAEIQKQQREEETQREASRPKVSWEGFQHVKTGDKLAIIGPGTQQQALDRCGLEYLPNFQRDGQRLNDELYMRYQKELQRLSSLRDQYERARLLGEFKHSVLAGSINRDAGTWFYMGKNWQGSNRPWLVAGKDNGDLNKVAVIVCLDASNGFAH